MSKRKAVRFAVRFTASVAIFGAATIILAGFSAFAMRSSRALPIDSDEPQVANRAVKASRLGSLLPAAQAPNEPASFVLASAPQGADLERFFDTVMSAQPMLPATTTTEQPAAPEAAAAAPEPKKPQPVAAAAAAPEKPKRPAPPPETSNMLDDGAIAGLKTRLRLTEDQVGYWPAVENALREVARTQLRHSKKPVQAGKVNIDVNSPEVQRLIWAATPLIMRLRADQKNEVRKLARIMGLEQVAQQI
ncbi:MAG: hypothetical protein K2Z80_17970 [Xanthobacteraceae bacterium]|nr:hypothetical protein [Xanthobacteraceae bacterium]